MRRLFLMYHHAGPPPPEVKKKHLYASRDQMLTHIGLLRRLGYRFTTVRAALTSSEDRIACVTFDDGYRDNFEIAFPALSSEGVPATLFVVTGDVGKKNHAWAPEDKTPTADLLDWEPLRKLHASGWEIGSHAQDHVRLARLTNGEQRRMIFESAEAIEKAIGHRPRSFAYPYGSYNALTLELLREAGFACALTTKGGLSRPGDDPFQLRRNSLWGYKPVHLRSALKLLGVHWGLYPFRKKPLMRP